MENAERYEEFLRSLITPLLSEPAAVEMRSSGSQGTTTVHFRVHPDDTGRVIGKGGAGISALRHLMDFAARRDGDFVALELEDD